MADYVLTCPRCSGGMYDQRAPTNQWPWKPGTPIAKCKDKECAKAGGVYWEDSFAKPGNKAVPVPKVTPTFQQTSQTPTRGPIMQADAGPATATYAELVQKHTSQHFLILADVAIRYAQLIDEAKGTTKEILATATADTLHAIAATIAIGLQRR